MAKNFVAPGSMLTTVGPTGGIASGAGMLAGALFGVAAGAALEGKPLELNLTGIWTLPKKAADDLSTIGMKVYWDDDPGEVTLTATDHVLIGAVAAAAGVNATTVAVRLNGITI